MVAVFQRGKDVSWYAVSSSLLSFPLAAFLTRVLENPSLALAEMKTLLAAIYQTYETKLSPEFEKLSPTATSRFELVYDDAFPIMKVCPTVVSLAAAMNS